MKKQLLLLIFALFSIVNTAIYAQQPVCGGTFTDPAGATLNYANSSDYTVTICPNNPGDLVTVTFTSFSTEANWDALYVFNGNSTTSPQIASNNLANNVPGGLPGGFWGTAIPGPFTSSDASGCLTFRFRSDTSVNMAGWVANVTCAPAPTCPAPTSLTATNITSTSAVLGWTNTSAATSWDIIVLPCGSPAPLATTTGFIVTTTANPYVLTGLNPGTCYDTYVRGNCSTADISSWSSVETFTTIASCPTPTALVTSAITPTSVTLAWTNNSDSTNWEVIALPCGTLPTPNNVGTATSTNPYVFTGLNPSTCYTLFVKAICTSGGSNWSIAAVVTTTATPPPSPVCGGTFTDNGGPNANYANATDSTVTICPTNPGEVVNVIFSSFSTEANWDALYVFNGNSIAAPQISSGNPAGNVPGGLTGGFWGTTIPGPFTSTSVDGCLTFRFRSDTSVNMTGWVAEVYCATYSGCVTPTAVSATLLSDTSASISWTAGSATQWEVLILPATAAAPTQSTPGTVTTSNPYLATGLLPNTAYKAYVKEICDATNSSFWSNGVAFSTSCGTPTNLVVSGINSNGGILNWASTNANSIWEIYIVPTGSPAPTATSTGVVTTTKPYSISGLTPGATYQVYVRTICSATFLSDWSGATTFTTIITLPPLTTNTTQYTPTQLISNVLVNNPCITISNVTSSTGLNFGSVNGLGYFTNTNPTFPINSGIVLSTGNVASIPGPNTSTLGEGSSAWIGDTQLETIITTATGQVMSSRNATKLEFDFTSLNESMSFNFLFASEEYGSFQCSYSDAFAFLLTDIATGVTTNIAVVPGTTTPISVVTIRDAINNTACASVNPDYFDTYYSGSNVYSSATNFNGQTTVMTASSQIIANHPYHIKLVVADRGDNAFDSAVFIQAGSFTSGPPECNDKIKLVAFIDTNSNGVKDTGESNFSYGSFVYQQNNVGDTYNVSSPFGEHTLYDSNSSNTYDFSYGINAEYAAYYSAGTTNYNDINIPVGSGTQTFYFPITVTQGYNDVSITIIPIGQPRPGFNYTNKIVYKNLGVATTSGTINFVKDAAVSVVSVSQPGTVSNASGFSFNFVNLAAYETRSFNVVMSVPTIPTVNIDDVLTNNATISAPANDIVLSNNAFSNSQIVVASYDPNDITEAHGRYIQHDQFTANDYLYYTIRFQNTGTANAINVRLENTLDSQLDEESIRMVSASHNYVLERVNNELVWKFDFINLVGAVQNEELSNGYVTYKIKVNPGFAVGDIIPNTAEIYFDTNPAVITNTFNTEFVAALGNETFSAENILLFPNPTTNSFQINIQNTNERLESIVVYDVLGKNVKTIVNIATSQTSVDVSNLSKGVYLVEITTENKLKLIKKLVIQ